ncbi:MAG: SDR family NAD(P)-dependent oxidoreductase [Rubinisphaera brasiliensis]|uniref:SDR family NAD(P)-dependent oxidoreductase n=1 Tax=Rubinisphaera brasiliensis TaxID=119 RepID=UPI00391B325C
MASNTFADLSGRRAVVTGASSGIGQAVALELARAGANVIVHYRSNRAGAEQTAVEIRKFGCEASLLQADLSDHAAAEKLVEDCFAQGQVDIWVNNAGVDVLTGTAREWSFEEKLSRLLAVDVQATCLLGRRAGKMMRAQGTGSIINIGWDQAERGMEGDSGELFSTTKNAVMGFSRSLAVSLAPEVRVNCVAPGWIKTAWGEVAPQAWQDRVMAETPLKRWGLPEDIAKVVRFLVSDDARYLTGQVIYANGGAER